MPGKSWLRNRAREALEASGFNTKKARDRLISQAKRDPELEKELLQAGADQIIRNFYSSERRDGSIKIVIPPITSKIIRASGIPSPEAEERQKQKQERRLFWDRYTLFGHTPLRDATRPDLDESVEKRKQQSNGILVCAAFEADISGRLRNDSIIVSKALKDKDIIALAKVHHVI